jgi:hypothetical protein
MGDKMIKIENYNKVLEFLKKDRIQNLNIIGIIENCEDISVFVDNPLDVHIVHVNRHYFNYVYTKDLEKIDLIKPFFEDKKYFGFSGLETSISNYIQDNFGIKDWESPCNLYYLPDDIQIQTNNHDYLRKLLIKDAKEVNDHYTYKSKGTLTSLKEDIKKRPSVCAKIDGELVSWVLTHPDNSLGVMFTKEEYRNKNLAYEVTMKLIEEHRKIGLTPFVQIVKGNFKSEGLATKCSFIKYGEAIWFGIKK